ncbi:MAG: ABC transporter permease [Erysipelotrichaceae bacterium]|nr:ABC transporter permease [Erysipelotrichaceae bacterium]
MEQITYLGLFLLSLLVIPTLMVNRFLEIRLNSQIVQAMIRMFVQLFVVGIYLKYIFEWDNNLLNLAYILVMELIATSSTLRGIQIKNRKLFFPLFLTVMVPNLALIFFFNFILLRLGWILPARYVITIGGMLLGNVLNGNIVGLNTFYNGIKANQEILNYELTLGATLFQACKPHISNALTLTIKPTIASMATLGLVALPGMMTGQILGGALPSDAIMYQIAIMIAIYLNRYFTIIGGLGVFMRYLFDCNDQLV